VYDAKRLEPGAVPMSEKQQRAFENIRDLIVDRFGSTGVQEALRSGCAVGLSGVVFCCLTAPPSHSTPHTSP
jgi:hypothetical protein